VVTIGTGRQTYRWESSASNALDAVRTGFSRAEPRKKVELLRKYAERDPVLAKEFAGELASQTGEAERSDPGLAWELFFALERSSLLPSSLAGLPDRLLAPGADLRRLLDGIEDRQLRERALAMIRERRADWIGVYRDQLLREADPRVSSLLADGLATGDRALFDRLLDDIVAQPRKAPAAFVWLAERAAEDEALRARTPLRLIQQLLTALGSEEFTSFRVRLRPLVESGGTLPRLFAHLGEEHASAALEALQRATALEAYHRDPLSNALRLRFSSLRQEESGGPLYSTAEAIEAKRSELKRLAEVEIPANRKAIEEARAMGDLRENFEYKSARQRHEYLSARAGELSGDLSRSKAIDLARLDLSRVGIGTAALLRDETGSERQLTLLGPWESAPESGVLSYQSEVAQSLLGAKPGDQVDLDGKSYRVVTISPARA
jgi:transcription elongation GreA/GreB family factor